jgi:hypothetical protein
VTRKNFSFENNKSGTGNPPEIERALQFVGIFTRVANHVGVSTSHAVAVARGRRTSKKVVDAIVREVKRIDRRTERAA